MKKILFILSLALLLNVGYADAAPRKGKKAKKTNYEQIYLRDQVSSVIDRTVKPIMDRMYHQLYRS